MKVGTRSRCCQSGPRNPNLRSTAKACGSKRMPSLGTDQRGEGIEFLDEIERALDVVEGLAPRPEDEGVAVLAAG